MGVEEPPEVHLGVGVAVVENHVEELRGGLQGCLLVHLEADGAAVVQVAVGRVVFAHGGDEFVLKEKIVQNILQFILLNLTQQNMYIQRKLHLCAFKTK